MANGKIKLVDRPIQAKLAIYSSITQKELNYKIYKPNEKWNLNIITVLFWYFIK